MALMAVKSSRSIILYKVYHFYLGEPHNPENREKKEVHVPHTDTLKYPVPERYPLTTKGFISVFNDILEELVVIKCVMNEYEEDDWHNLIEYKTIEERYGKIKDEFYNYTNNKNILRHVCELYNIFYAGFLELTEFQSFTVFRSAISTYFHLMNDETRLIDEAEHNQQLVVDMKNAIVNERRSLVNMIESKKLKLFHLQEKLEDIRVYGNLEQKYTNNWEAARLNQKSQDLKDKEDYFINIKQDADHRSNMENRINMEIRTYTEERITDLHDEIEYWSDHYDAEVDRRDAELGKLRMELEIHKEDLEKTIEEYERRKEFVEERLALKEARRAAAERIRLELWAAVKIQAWWRGTMVRKKLGPFKKKKKKKKGDKDKKGKKKK